MSRGNFNMSLHGAEKWEESRRLCMSEQETTMPFTLQQRNCDHEEECLKEKAEKEYYKNRYFQSQAEFFKVNSKCKSCIDCEEFSIRFENLSSGGNCRGLKKELCREMTAKEHSKTRYLQSQTGLLRVQSLWENFKKKLERKITELQHKSSCGNENNTDLKREITKLSLVLDEFCVQAEVWQQENNQPQSFLKQISSPKEFFSVELEQNEDRCYELSDAGSVDQDAPKVQKHGEINTPGSKQEETSAGKAKKPKDTHCITADTKSEVRVLSVQEGFGSTLESEAQNCELEQIKAVRQRHDSEHSMETRRLDVQEGTKQGCFLLRRHCDHKTSLFKKTAKKEYYKRKCLGSQVELFKLYLKRKYFNNRSEDKTTKFENVSLICINLQRQIFKLKSEKEHYTNQCLQLQAGLLRVHSMWENLKTQLESNMSELQNVNLSGKHDNLDLGTEIDELGLALDELLIQLEASEQNCNQTQNLLKPNKNIANWTFSAEVEQIEHRRYTFVDSEDKQCDVPKVQDLILSLKIKAPESAQEETFAATTEELQDTHCISIEAKSERLDLLKVEKFSTLFDPKVTECVREQTSTLGSVFLKERQDTKQSKGSQCLCLPEAERTKLFSLQKRVCDLEAELSKGNDEKENYKKLLDKSQAELLEMHAMLNNSNQKPEEKTAVPLNVSLSGNDSNDDVGENIKGLHEAADAFEFQAQRIEDLSEKLKLTEPKETDPKDTFSSKVKHDEHTCYMFLDAENEHPVVPRHDAEQNKESRSVCTPEAEITKLFSLQQRNCDLEAELLNEKGEKDFYKKLYDKSQTELLELRATVDNLNQMSEEKTAALLNASSSGNEDVDENIKGLREAADAFEFQAQRIEDLAEKLNKTSSEEADHNEHRFHMILDAGFEDRDVPNVQSPSGSMEITAPESVPEETSAAAPKELKETHCVLMDTKSLDFVLPQAEKSSTFLDIKGPKCKQQHISALEGELLDPGHDTEQNKESQSVCTPEAEIITLVYLQQRVCDLEAEVSNGNDEKEYYKKLYSESQAELLEMHAMLNNFNQKPEEKTAVPLNPSSSGNDSNYDVDENIKGLREAADAIEFQAHRIEDLSEKHKKLTVPKETDPKDTFSFEVKHDEHTCYMFLDAENEHPVVPRHDAEQNKESRSVCTPEAEITKLFSLQQRNCDLEAELLNEKGEKDYYKKLYDKSQTELLELRATVDNLNQMSEEKTAALLHASSSGNEDVDENIKGLREAADAFEFQAQRIEDLSEKLKKLTEPKETDPKDTFSSEVKHDEHTCYMFLDAENEHPAVPRHDAEQNKESRRVCTPEAEITKLFSLQQRNCDLEAELLNEKDEKNFYKKLLDKLQAELLEFHAIVDNLNQMSEKKTAALLNASSSGNEDVDENIKGLRAAADAFEFQAQRIEDLAEKLKKTFSEEMDHNEHRFHMILDAGFEDRDVPNVQSPSGSMEITAPESVPEETSAAAPKELKETHCVLMDTKSLDFVLPQAEKSSTFLDIKDPKCKQQQMSALEGELLDPGHDTEQNKESQSVCTPEAEIITLVYLQQRVCDLEAEVSNGNDEKEYYKKLYSESQAELLEMHAMLNNFNQKPEEKTAVPLNPSSSGNDDVDENIKGLREAADAFEFQAQRIEDLAEKLKKFTEPKETDPKNTFSEEVDHNEQIKESQSSCVPEAEIPEWFLEQQRVCDLEAEVLQEKAEKDYSRYAYNESEAEVLELCSKLDTLNIMSEGKTNVPENALSSGNDNANVKENAGCLHLASDALQFQGEISEQSETKPNQTMPEEMSPVASLEIGSVDFRHSNYSTEDEQYNIGHHSFLNAKSKDLTEPGKYFQMSTEFKKEETSVVEGKTHEQRDDMFFDTNTDECELQKDSSCLNLLSSESEQGEMSTTEGNQNKQKYTSIMDTTIEHLNIPQQKKDLLEVASPESEQGEVLMPASEQLEQTHETFFETDSQETASELDSATAAVETAIPEEETATIEAENHEIRCPPIFDTQSDHLIALEERKGSPSLDIEFTESDLDVYFPALDELPEQNYDTFFEPGYPNTSPESKASLEVLKLDVQTQKQAADVGGEETLASEGRSLRFWQFTVKVLRNMSMSFVFSILSAYTYQTLYHNVDLTHGLYNLLEHLCTFEHVVPVPF